MKKIIFILTLICLFMTNNQNLFAQTKNFKWTSINGAWTVRDDNNTFSLISQKDSVYQWNYSELINYNSIINNTFYNNINNFNYQIIFTPSSSSGLPEFLFFFCAENLKNFYAIKFSGDSNEINTIKVISCKIKDTTRKPSEKNNFVITELNSKNYKLNYKTKYDVNLKIASNTLILFVDNKEVLNYQLVNPQLNLKFGKFGFANRNGLQQIYNFRGLNDQEIIFQDDFSKDSLQKVVVEIKKEEKK